MKVVPDLENYTTCKARHRRLCSFSHQQNLVSKINTQDSRDGQFFIARVLRRRVPREEKQQQKERKRTGRLSTNPELESLRAVENPLSASAHCACTFYPRGAQASRDRRRARCRRRRCVGNSFCLWLSLTGLLSLVSGTAGSRAAHVERKRVEAQKLQPYGERTAGIAGKTHGQHIACVCAGPAPVRCRVTR